MTREEAREALSVLKIYDAPRLREAVDMAIEALQAKTDGDIISKSAVMETIGYWTTTEEWGNCFIPSELVEMINALPSADRPTELLKDGTLKVNVKSGADVNRVLVWGDDMFGGLYYADGR